jgi:hypothetical protein
MPADTPTRDGFSLRRWSRRKLDATRASEAADAASPLAPPAATSASIPISTTSGAPAAPTPEVAPALPPVESLTIDSDFAAFLQPHVDESLKRQALKKLFADPRFNVMDGLDTYIDDYTKSDPIPPDVLERLMRTFTFNPPVPDEPPKEATAESSSAAATRAQPEERDEVAGLEPPSEVGTAPVPVSGSVTPPSDAVIRSAETDGARDASSGADAPDPPASR